MTPETAGLVVVELKVTLLDVRPQVWRRFRVPGAVTLSGLHSVMQLVMGWQDAHLHQWTVGGTVYGPPEEEDWGEGLEDETGVVLTAVAGPDAAFGYEYDLGDGWEHLVEVLAVTPFRGDVVPVACLDGAGACPPEDCGGPAGYEHLLDALANPNDPEHEDLLSWVGDGFDPREFDVALVNRRLELLWRPKG